MGRNNADFEEGSTGPEDRIAKKLAAKGIIKNTHGQSKPEDNEEWMQEPDFDRW